MIWCDPVNIFESLGWFLYLSFRGQGQQQPWQVMATIDQAEPVANFRRGFSFVLAPAAVDPVLDLDNFVH
jgi:hypothetical protein